MSKSIHQAIDSLLKESSRSFYLTLKALPPRIRPVSYTHLTLPTKA